MAAIEGVGRLDQKRRLPKNHGELRSTPSEFLAHLSAAMNKERFDRRAQCKFRRPRLRQRSADRRIEPQGTLSHRRRGALCNRSCFSLR